MTTVPSTPVEVMKHHRLLIVVLLLLFLPKYESSTSSSDDSTSSSTDEGQERTLAPWQQCDVFLAPSKSSPSMGWSVYAGRSFDAGEIVHIAPLFIPVPPNSFLGRHTILDDYIYGYYRIDMIQQKLLNYIGVMFGMVMFANHHTEPNVVFTTFGREPIPKELPYASNAVGFAALRHIKRGEEIFSSYGKEDGGYNWFGQRKIPLQVPTVYESQIPIEQINDSMKKYCSKVFAGTGWPTWKNNILSILPPDVPFYIHPTRFAPGDAGIGNAVAKVKIRKGERIDIAPALMLPLHSINERNNNAAASPVGVVSFQWNELNLDHQDALRSLRDQGILHIQYQGEDNDWERVDNFTSLEESVVFPVAGYIGLIRRVGKNSTMSNCRLVIRSDGIIPNHQLGIPLEIIATKDISVGEILKLNLPHGGRLDHIEALWEELQLTGQPHYAGLLNEYKNYNKNNEKVEKTIPTGVGIENDEL